MTRTSTLAGAITLALAIGCGDRAKAPDKRPAPAVLTKDVIATVNGRPITQADLEQETPGDSHGKPPSPDRERNLLETMIRQELAAQKAAELGLDADPAYREELARLEAQVNTFRRKRLSDAFYRAEAAKRAQVTEDEARRYFDQNAPRMRTELHVLQILTRDEARIEELRQQLAAGAPFEEVAKQQLPAEMPEGERPPWDLGYLRWHQVPEAWRPVVYGLADGQTSEVIRGPNQRFWIVKVVARRENPEITFESEKQRILESLREERIARFRAEIDAELRKNAQIVYPGKP